MPKNLAKFRQAVSLAPERIDRDAGVIYGVKLAELNRVACFEGIDGKPRYALISPRYVSALLSLAGSRSIPSHWTHSYLDPNFKGDNLDVKVAALKNFRKDTTGNPIADMYVEPTEYADRIYWNALHAPDSMMLSPVTEYKPGDNDSIPIAFNAADLVADGAATTSLLAKFSAMSSDEQLAALQNNNAVKQPTNNDNKNMDPQQLLAAFLQLLQDPANVAKIGAALGVSSAGGDTAIADMQGMDDAAAAMETAAGVTDADKKDETDTDKRAPAIMRAFKRCGKAFSRRVGEAEVSAVAAMTRKIGNGEIITTSGGDSATKKEMPAVARMRKMRESGMKMGAAKMSVARVAPKEYNAWVEAGEPLPTDFPK